MTEGPLKENAEENRETACRVSQEREFMCECVSIFI